MLGLGTGSAVYSTLASMESFVKAFGHVATVGGGIIAAAGVMGLAFKIMKVLNRIDTTSSFTADQLMKDEPGTLRRDIRESREYVEEAKHNAAAAKEMAEKINTRSVSNEGKLDRVLGHTHAHKEQIERNAEIEKEILEKQQAELNKLNKIDTTTIEIKQAVEPK